MPVFLFILVFFVRISFSEKKTPKRSASPLYRPFCAGSSDFGYLLVEQGITSSFGTADQDLSWNTDGYVKIQSSPLYTTQSGAFTGGSFNYQSYGFLWSDTTYSGTNTYSLNYSSSNVTPANFNNRQNGFPVRCITRDFNFLLVQYGIAVNYVGEYSDAKWVTSGYNNVQNNPLYIPRSGYFNGGGFGSQASFGNLWSGTTYSGTNAYALLYSSSVVSPAYIYNSQRGFPVRCIARHLVYNQKSSGNRAFRKIFIMSFLRWDFFFKRSPKLKETPSYEKSQ